jgi:hypothetical protein
MLVARGVVVAYYLMRRRKATTSLPPMEEATTSRRETISRREKMNRPGESKIGNLIFGFLVSILLIFLRPLFDSSLCPHFCIGIFYRRKFPSAGLSRFCCISAPVLVKLLASLLMNDCTLVFRDHGSHCSFNLYELHLLILLPFMMTRHPLCSVWGNKAFT